ncbi:PAS domain S-box protein [Microvirga sp. KLBC 81]|uniref:PAS domain S-box protein n=1 Tax=Microvirga sp. KLBC 81 TaxID=1862707 RepID=UPI001403DBEA|nr:PAS domain S-box protein [Microvirga sp. KLBC 81]
MALPILVFVGFILWQFASAERARLEGNALDTAHVIAADVDRELTSLRSALSVLVHSQFLQNGDIDSFNHQVTSANLMNGINIVLRAPDGQQLVNTRVPRGEPLPKTFLPSDQAAIDLKKPVVTDLFTGSVSGTPLYAVTMPVIHNDEIVYLLSVSGSVERLQKLSRREGIPIGWTIAVVDRGDRILARNARHEEFVGKPATRDLQENTTGPAGTWRGFTIDGQPVLGAYARSQLSDWRVAVGVRDVELAAPLRHSLWYLGWLGAGLAALSAGMAWLFGRHITAPMEMLAAQAVALGRGEMVARSDIPVHEVAKVSDALAAASADLRQRERERDAAEAALRESEERFRFAFEAAGGVGSWDWDVPNDRIYANETFASFFGVDPEHAGDGAPLSAFVAGMHPEDRVTAGAEIENAIATGMDYSAEYRVIGSDGATRWIAARGRCYHDETGKPLRFPGIAIDLTERKRTEEALAASERRLQAILDTIPVGIVIAEAPSGRIISGNAQVERIFGHPVLPSQDVESYRDWIGFHPDGRQVQAAEYPMARVLRGAEERAEMELLYRRGDGRKAWLRLMAAPIRDEVGRIVAGVVACLDVDREKQAEAALRSLNATLEQRIAEAITEREKAEAQLRQAQKMEAVGRLTGGVAHDFNNLLTVITGNLEMLRRKVENSGDPRLVRNVDNAVEGAKRAAQLTHRLLAFSRQSPLQPEVVDLNKIVAGMSELLRRTIGENIAIETVLAGGLWRTEADPNQLESAILNLAVNARDAMPEGGKLTLETANTYLDEAYSLSTGGEIKAGQYVMVSVSDTGSGMTPDVKAKVFEPFFTTKPVGKGTGLGLAQVYGFTRQSGGHAAIYSELGQGTTVKLYFPRMIRPGDMMRPVEETPAPAAALVDGETILVVEDEDMVRDFSVSVLEDAGYRVLAAEDGQAALRLLLANRDEIALLFTDVVLAGSMNGRKVADEALKIRPDLKVLFTTGYTRNAIVHHGRLDEGIQLITKPFAAASLVERVRRILDEKGS